jgi:hypothetical protein
VATRLCNCECYFLSVLIDLLVACEGTGPSVINRELSGG